MGKTDGDLVLKAAPAALGWGPSRGGLGAFPLLPHVKRGG